MSQGYQTKELIEGIDYFILLNSKDLGIGPLIASERIMENAKYKLEVPGYTKENITISVKTDDGSYDVLGYWNPPMKYFEVVADNEEFGRKTAELAPTSEFDPASVCAEVKNGILYLGWDAPKALESVTVRID